MRTYGLLLSLVLIAISLVGCAAAPASYHQRIQQAIVGDGWIHVTKKNGRVILYGSLEDKVAEAAVLNAAWSDPGVTEVINHIHIDFD